MPRKHSEISYVDDIDIHVDARARKKKQTTASSKAARPTSTGYQPSYLYEDVVLLTYLKYY